MGSRIQDLEAGLRSGNPREVLAAAEAAELIGDWSILPLLPAFMRLLKRADTPADTRTVAIQALTRMTARKVHDGLTHDDVEALKPMLDNNGDLAAEFRGLFEAFTNHPDLCPLCRKP